ncbi:hypothetical protein [Helicobacter sp. 23-1045]
MKRAKNLKKNFVIARKSVGFSWQSKILRFAESQILPLPCGGGLRGWVKSQKLRQCENLTCQIRSNSQKKIKIDCHNLPLANLAMTNQSQILRIKRKTQNLAMTIRARFCKF